MKSMKEGFKMNQATYNMAFLKDCLFNMQVL